MGKLLQQHDKTSVYEAQISDMPTTDFQVSILKFRVLRIGCRIWMPKSTSIKSKQTSKLGSKPSIYVITGQGASNRTAAQGVKPILLATYNPMKRITAWYSSALIRRFAANHWIQYPPSNA